jgi:hypothetical protein
MDEEKRLREALAKSAEKLGAVEPPARDFRFFRELVERQQAAARRVQRRQLALFTAVAALLVSAIIVFMGSYPVFILALQCAAVAGAIAGLAVFFARSRKLKAGADG